MNESKGASLRAMPQNAQLIALDAQRAPDAVSEKNAESLNVLVSALAHPLRMHVLRVMRADSFSVSELCAAFSVRQSALSHHLKILTDAGFLARRREGTATFYRRQLPEGIHESLRQQILDEIDEESMPTDLVAGLQAVQRLREGHSAAFFRDRGKEIRKQQESIASWEDYSRATLHLLDRAGDFGESALIEVGPGDGACSANSPSAPPRCVRSIIQKRCSTRRSTIPERSPISSTTWVSPKH